MATHTKMSFSTGGLFVNESVELARLHQEGNDWKDTIATALANGNVSLPKAASNRRTLREIANRVSSLTEDERRFLVEDADRSEKEALLWIATCRAYPFVREFAIEVICERLLSYRLELTLDAFDQFFDKRAEWDEGMAAISLSTRKKLRQVLFRIMREAGVIDLTNTIRSSYLSSRLRALIVSNDQRDLLVFPGLRL